jgi:hypothetical protein
MLENEIKVVDKLINTDKAHYISENELKWLCRDDFNADCGMVVAILKNKYNATYVPSDEPRFCGGYKFDNPNLQKQDYAILNDIYLRQENPKVSALGMARLSGGNKYYENFAKEILRLEHKVKTPLEDIIKALKEKSAFIGEDRIWFITFEKDY